MLSVANSSFGPQGSRDELSARLIGTSKTRDPLAWLDQVTGSADVRSVLERSGHASGLGLNEQESPVEIETLGHLDLKRRKLTRQCTSSFAVRNAASLLGVSGGQCYAETSRHSAACTSIS